MKQIKTFAKYAFITLRYSIVIALKAIEGELDLLKKLLTGRAYELDYKLYNE